MQIKGTPETWINELHQLFLQDPYIDEIGILWTLDEVADEQVDCFGLIDHKLAIQSNAIMPMFKVARQRLVQLRQTPLERPDQQLLELNQVSRALVLLSADGYTGWNVRRKLLSEDKYLELKSEFRLCNLVFSQRPKSIDTWAYRKWLAIRYLSRAVGEDRDVFLQEELSFCDLISVRSARNYHGWAYRNWISRFLPLEKLLYERAKNEDWVRQHLSDHSSLYYRMHLMKLLIDLASDGATQVPESLLHEEFQLVDELIQNFPKHESLWCYRRLLFVKWTQMLQQQVPFELISQIEAFVAKAIVDENSLELNESLAQKEKKRELFPMKAIATKLSSAADSIIQELLNAHIIAANKSSGWTSSESDKNLSKSNAMRYMLWVLSQLFSCAKCEERNDFRLIKYQQLLCDLLQQHTPSNVHAKLWQHVKK